MKRFIPNLWSTLFLLGVTTATNTTTSSANLTSIPGQPTTSQNTNPGWSSLGCYSDDASRPTLRNHTRDLNSLTVENCQSECTNTGFLRAGLKAGTQCWCDLAVQGGTKKVEESQCNLPCSGDNTENCGGDSVIDLYSYRPTPSRTPLPLPSPTSAQASQT